MLQSTQIGARGIVETHFCPVVWVRPPTHVMQQAGRFDQPETVRGHLAEQRQDEIEQRSPETGQAGILGFRELARFD